MSKPEDKEEKDEEGENKFESKLPLERHLDRIARLYRAKLPWLYSVCFDPVGQHREARKLFGFLLGFGLGLFLYLFIIADLQLGEPTGWICGVVLIALLSLGCAQSLKFRCTCLLAIPGFFGRAGRSVLKALVLGYVIAGPVLNLSLNAREVMRSFSCTGQLAYNLTKTKYDLMLAPFQQCMQNVNASAPDVRRTLSTVNEIIEPIAREIEGEDEENEEDEEEEGEEASGWTTTVEPRRRSKRRRDAGNEAATGTGEYYEQKYRQKLTARCQKQLSRGSGKCKKAFRDAYNRCMESVTWVAGWVLCWPMKLTFACNLVEALGGGKICDPGGKLQAGFGEGYVTLKETRDKMNESLSKAEINYKVDTKGIGAEQAKEARRAAAGVMRDFEARKRLLDGLIGLIKRCLSFVFLKIVLNASEYRSKYLSDIEHDNVYVTRYFRRIDARRRARGALTLLPLKKLERTKLLEPCALQQSRAEKRHLFGQSAKLLLELATASILVLLDKLLFDLLDVIHEHAKLEISQSGQHDVSLEIQGAGLMAALIRRLVYGLNRKGRVDQILTNEACLPRPSKVPRLLLAGIYLGYVGIWLLLLLQAYGLRLRRVIAAFFYRRREKRRVLHLYNETLRRRRGFLRWARSRAAQAARSRLLAPDARFWLDLRESRPKLWAWLRRLGWGRLDCAVCGEPEPKSANLSHHLCRAPDCLAAYCDECWRELGRSCWSAGCAPGAPPHDHDDDNDEDNEDNDNELAE